MWIKAKRHISDPENMLIAVVSNYWRRSEARRRVFTFAERVEYSQGLGDELRGLPELQQSGEQ